MQPNTPQICPKTHHTLLHVLERSITIAWAKTAPHLDSPSSTYAYLNTPHFGSRLPPRLPPKKNRSTPPPTDVSGSDRTTSDRRRHPTRRRHVSPRDRIAAAVPAREAQEGPPRARAPRPLLLPSAAAFPGSGGRHLRGPPPPPKSGDLAAPPRPATGCLASPPCRAARGRAVLLHVGVAPATSSPLRPPPPSSPASSQLRRRAATVPP